MTQTETEKTVALASDHRGVALRQVLADALRARGLTVMDLGPDGEDSVDYPDFASGVSLQISRKEADRGILICGTGIGISMAANRHPGVRAAVCWDETSARLTREHNDANVLALGARLLGVEVAKDCVRTFLSTDFAGGRHAGRVAKLG